jgi:hypothetical protein
VCSKRVKVKELNSDGRSEWLKSGGESVSVWILTSHSPQEEGE